MLIVLLIPLLLVAETITEMIISVLQPAHQLHALSSDHLLLFNRSSVSTGILIPIQMVVLKVTDRLPPGPADLLKPTIPPLRAVQEPGMNILHPNIAPRKVQIIRVLLKVQEETDPIQPCGPVIQEISLPPQE